MGTPISDLATLPRVPVGFLPLLTPWDTPCLLYLLRSYLFQLLHEMRLNHLLSRAQQTCEAGTVLRP